MVLLARLCDITGIFMVLLAKMTDFFFCMVLKRATRAPQDVFLMKFQKQLKLYRSRKTKSD
jgi:hypothetical protein